jgi:nickel-dependent lactate racemase
MKRMAERMKEEQERAEAATKAAADEVRHKAERKAWKKQRLAAVVVDDKTRLGFLRTAVTRLLAQLRARKWDGWPYSDGNPFLTV